jgi:hypothetical protein
MIHDGSLDGLSSGANSVVWLVFVEYERLEPWFCGGGVSVTRIDTELITIIIWSFENAFGGAPVSTSEV